MASVATVRDRGRPAVEQARAEGEIRRAKRVVNNEVLSCTAMTTMVQAGEGISEGDFISSRGNYFQGTFIALICSVYNFVLTFIFSIAALCCLCQNDEMNFLTKKFLIVTAVSLATIGAGVVGTFYPAWAQAYIGDKKEESGLAGFFLDHAVGVSGYLGAVASGGNVLGADENKRSSSLGRKAPTWRVCDQKVSYAPSRVQKSSVDGQVSPELITADSD